MTIQVMQTMDRCEQFQYLSVVFSVALAYKRVVCYRPQRSCGQGNIFTPVCHSVHKGGMS